MTTELLGLPTEAQVFLEQPCFCICPFLEILAVRDNAETSLSINDLCRVDSHSYGVFEESVRNWGLRGCVT